MMASAGPRVISPSATKEVVNRAVALLLCTSAVTTMPAPNASGRLRVLRLRVSRNCEPYTRRMPVRTICVPHTRRATADNRLSRVSMTKPPRKSLTGSYTAQPGG
ncbi:hypothetical protein D3C77_608990 [compost metagenome]